MECDAKEDEEEEEEEEEFTTRPNLPQPLSAPTASEREQATPTSPAPTRKPSKRKGKKNASNGSGDSGLATPTSGSTTAATRTSLQTPAASTHAQLNDSWEEDESGDDEMFVDAPSEFLPGGGGPGGAPSSPKNCNGLGEGGYRKVGPGGSAGKSSRDQKAESSDARHAPSLSRSNKGNGKRSKSLKEETKGGGGGGGGVKRSSSQKVMKTGGNNGGGELTVPATTEGVSVPHPQTRSPGEKKRKTGGGGGGGKKSPDPPSTNDKKSKEGEKGRD